MISVVIPLYNKRNCIASTIDSVLSQTYSDFELIVVDDGSTDGSADVVRSIADERVRLIQKTNGGVSSARNVGVVAAKSEHIAFLDADDIWAPNYLAEIAKLIHDFPEAGIYGSSYTVQEHGELIPHCSTLSEDFYGIVDMSEWRFGHLYWTSIVCCKKAALEEAGMFDERMAYGEDTDVWWRIMLKHPAAYSNKELATYRYDAENRAMVKKKPLEKLYINYFEKYSEYRKSNDAFRHFIDKECMWWLFQYALEDKHNPDVQRILSQIDLSEYKYSFRFRFKYPRLYKLLRK